MRLKINDGKKEIYLNGSIKRKNNRFITELEVPVEQKLGDLIDNIKGYYDPIGNVTLINNKNISIKGSQSDPKLCIYEYESGYVISSHVDEKKVLVKSMILYYKELDSFFVKDKYKIDMENLDKQFTVTQRFKREKLLEKDDICIEYAKTAEISKDEYGHILFLTPSKIELLFKEPIKLPKMFEEIAKVESCFGFVIGKKMNLIDVEICDSHGILHDVVAPFQKKYEDIILNESFVVDVNSKRLLKDVLNAYYSNRCIAATINMYYEYIYNDLDMILEFTSLVNTLELILTDTKHINQVEKYTLLNNNKLKENNEKMMDIFKILSAEQCEFLKKFYNFNNIELRDKFKYIFYYIFNLEKSINSDKYISKIINTRNYYVHGGNKKNILDNVEMLCTIYLLKSILYVLIMEICSNNTNSIIVSYKMTIPAIYENLVKH